jgi:hypothetical protein
MAVSIYTNLFTQPNLKSTLFFLIPIYMLLILNITHFDVIQFRITSHITNQSDIWAASWSGYISYGRMACTSTWQHKTERRRQTSIPWEEFEPTIPESKRPDPNVVDGTVTVIGIVLLSIIILTGNGGDWKTVVVGVWKIWSSDTTNLLSLL